MAANPKANQPNTGGFTAGLLEALNPFGHATGAPATPSAPTSTPTPKPAAGGGFDNAPISGQQGSTLVNPSGGQTATATSPSTIIVGVPDDFAKMAQSVLSSRIGVQAYLIPGTQLNALILKIWQSPAIQYNWSQYQSDPKSQQAWAASVAQQVANEVLNPSDDPSITVDYTNLKLASGKGLSLAERTALANVSQAQSAMVPPPFTAQNVSGYDYGQPMPKGGWTGTGQSFGWDKHYGVDYGTPAGSRIVAPFAGTIEVRTGVAGYGNQVLLHLDNGWTLAFGHVAQGFGNGQRVNPGDLIAMSGQNVGSAKGAVTIVTWQDEKGNYQNPHLVMDPIFKGVSFSMLKDAQGNPMPSIAGTGMPSVNKMLDAEYPSIGAEWTRYFGSPPSPQDVYNVVQHGKSPEQWTDYIRSLPSHIPDMAAGNAYDLRNVADQISTKMYGHLATDGIVAELHGQGLTKPTDIQYFYDMMPGKDLDKTAYNNAFHANTAVTYNIFNEKGADPRVIHAQLGTGGGGQGIKAQ